MKILPKNYLINDHFAWESEHFFSLIYVFVSILLTVDRSHNSAKKIIYNYNSGDDDDASS